MHRPRMALLGLLQLVGLASTKAVPIGVPLPATEQHPVPPRFAVNDTGPRFESGRKKRRKAATISGRGLARRAGRRAAGYYVRGGGL